jgi:hypothetical protein
MQEKEAERMLRKRERPLLFPDGPKTPSELIFDFLTKTAQNTDANK